MNEQKKVNLFVGNYCRIKFFLFRSSCRAQNHQPPLLKYSIAKYLICFSGNAKMNISFCMGQTMKNKLQNCFRFTAPRYQFEFCCQRDQIAVDLHQTIEYASYSPQANKIKKTLSKISKQTDERTHTHTQKVEINFKINELLAIVECDRDRCFCIYIQKAFVLRYIMK